MRSMTGRGRFISLEGGEGAGKSTLTIGLCEALSECGKTVIATREPGGTPNAEAIRDILVSGATDRWLPTSEALLLYAARQEHVERHIKPALEAGQWVICDRFADSTRAYQGAAGNLSASWVNALNELVLGDFEPDLTLILDLDPEVGLERTRSRGEKVTRFEAHGLEYHRALCEGFLAIARDHPERCAVLDASQSADQILKSAMREIQSRLGGALGKSA